MGKTGRKTPSKALKGQILADQMGRCGYCNSSLVGQTIHWDHFVPYSYLRTNPNSNWVAACSKCNLIKSDKIFHSEEALTDFIVEMIKTHGSLADGWPEGSTSEWSDYVS